ncbi:MAG: hypothetical protein ABJZ55_16125 [Fuerstiella sp.]
MKKQRKTTSVTSNLPMTATRAELEADGYFERLENWLEPLIARSVVVTSYSYYSGKKEKNRLIGRLIDVDYENQICLKLQEIYHPWDGPELVGPMNLHLAKAETPYRATEYKVRQTIHIPEEIRAAVLRRRHEIEQEGD